VSALPGRVGINANFLEPHMGGLVTYVRELVPELARLASKTRFSVYCNPIGREYLAAQGWPDDIELVTPPLLGRPGLRAAMELTALGWLAGRQVDVLHSVALTAPLRTRAANVVTIADVTWMIHPDPTKALTFRVWQALVPPVARRADRVIAISNFVADGVVEQLGVKRERIDVISLGHGVEQDAQPTPEAELRRKLGLGDGQVLLCIAGKRPHKNLLRLVQAMPAIRERVPDAVLVLPGAPTPHEEELKAEAARLGLGQSVAFPDFLSPPDLEGLYAQARALVFPSLSEGFGLPVLEAMRRRVPVACAAASSLPEVAGDAALLFDPYSVPAIADAAVAVMTDDALRARLITAGLERQAGFTWARAAEGTLESYERAIAHRRRLRE
jgi:glycosyltransferase involved in cell wall biosynthesis